MRRSLRVLLPVLLGLAGAAEAQAFYGFGAHIVSAHFGRLEQADDASQFAAISGDGRYVVYQTRARNLFADDDPDPPGQARIGGIFRFDLATGVVELVADGNLTSEEDTNTLVVRGAQNPSVSADGRHVAFSTAYQHVPEDTNGNIDVYVRDMSVPIRAPGGFELVSARDGGDTPASYGPRDPDTPGLNPGAEVTRGAAISADGTKVVFRTTDATSDLPARPTTDTPGFQVFLRDRVANTTTLVTRRTSDGEPAGGALGPAGISRDGSTVVWTGQNAGEQTRFVGGENASPNLLYYLWRRAADGPSAPTRRITGVSDPDDPACPPDAQIAFDQSSTGPCFGPLTETEQTGGIGALLPAMSADGRRVAFLTGGGPRPNATTGPGLDLYLTDMSPGLTRKQSTTELTREGRIGDAASGAPIESVTMSADGRRLAITTFRTAFVLPALTLVGSSRLQPTVRELYTIDLETRTIERVVRASDGSDANGDVTGEATLSDDGQRVAFVSFAGNLFFGDGNERPDAFWVERVPEPAPGAGGGGGFLAGRPPAQVLLEEDPSGPVLGVRVRRGRKGRLTLRVRVPAPGTVTAAARARVGRPRVRRTLARRTRFAPRAGVVRIRLRVVRRYRRELARRGRIPVRIRVTFSPSRGGQRLGRDVRATFRK
jgi:Tol biopolymer transport system component